VPVERRDLARYAAPVAFLAAVTILIVLVHSALSSGGGSTTTRAQTQTQPAKRTTTKRTTTRKQTTTKASTTTSSTSTGATTSTGPAQYYTIQSGDTFGSIASREGTTVAALEALNPDVSSNALQVGQQIRVK
jgi:LysM repeat protein